MDIARLVESFRQDLSAVADAVGPDGRAAADRMLVALEPALQLLLMEALSQAAAEITAELAAGVVEVRLRGRDPELVVDVPAAAPTAAAPRPDPGPEDEEQDDGMIARVSLRIPESVKARAEELAARSGHSLNGWIVSVLRAATSHKVVNVDLDLSSIPFLDDRGPRRGGPGSGRRMSGWA